MLKGLIFHLAESLLDNLTLDKLTRQGEVVSLLEGKLRFLKSGHYSGHQVLADSEPRLKLEISSAECSANPIDYPRRRERMPYAPRDWHMVDRETWG